MRPQNGLYATRVVTGDLVYFCLGAAGTCQCNNGSATQIVKRQPADSGSHGCLPPRALESALAPRLALAIRQHDRALLRGRIKRNLQRISNRDQDIGAGLALAQFDNLTVIGAPWQAQ